MGDKNYKFTRARPVLALRLMAATLAGLLVLFIASIGSADEADPDSPVSTPPTLSATRLSDALGARSDRDRRANRPLTRAAARQFVETISPVDWLARFGRVEVGRRP